jgi:hypothetical protein
MLSRYLRVHALSISRRILANANGCAPIGGNKAPSFLLLDYVNIGDGLHAVDVLNGLAKP